MVGKFENMNSELTPDTETMYLKYKNKALAKALSEQKLLSKQYLDERNFLQKKVHVLSLLNMRYETNLKKMLVQSKKMLPNVLELSDVIGEMMKLFNDSINLSKNVSENYEKSSERLSICPVQQFSSPGTLNKTHAVKPMVSGHVIFRPTINLRRLTDPESSIHVNNITGITSQSTNEYVADNATNQHIDAIENENSNDNFQIITSHEAIPGLTFIDDEDDDEYHLPIDNLITEQLSDQIGENQMLPLQPVPEEDEESELQQSNTILREARVMILPLPISHTPSTQSSEDMTTNTSNQSITVKSPISSICVSSTTQTNLNYDPLEGPSTLLMNSSRFSRTHHRPTTKRRAVQFRSSDSDSDSSGEEWNTVSNQKSNVRAKIHNISKKPMSPLQYKNKTKLEYISKKGKKIKKFTKASHNTSADSIHEQQKKNEVQDYDAEMQLQNGVLKEARVTILPLPESLTKSPISQINKVSTTDKQNDSTSSSPKSYKSNAHVENVELEESGLTDDANCLQINNLKISKIKNALKEPVVLLTQMNHLNIKKVDSNLADESLRLNSSCNVSMENTSFHSNAEERPKRSKVKSNFKEASLRCKMRR